MMLLHQPEKDHLAKNEKGNKDLTTSHQLSATGSGSTVSKIQRRIIRRRTGTDDLIFS
jgi:methylglyoxal synthase